MLKNVENIVPKGEIVCFEQFFPFVTIFHKSSAAEASESIYMWEMVRNFEWLKHIDFHSITVKQVRHLEEGDRLHTLRAGPEWKIEEGEHEPENGSQETEYVELLNT